jgi:hypothetical protein
VGLVICWARGPRLRWCVDVLEVVLQADHVDWVEQEFHDSAALAAGTAVLLRVLRDDEGAHGERDDR